MPTLEEASRCPRCGQPGEHTATNPPAKGSGKVHTYTCRNERCKWLNTGWIIQVDAQGNIPMRRPGDKQFAPVPERIQQMGRDYLKKVLNEEEQGEIKR